MGLKTASLVPAAQPCRFKRSGAAGSGRGGTRLAGAAGRAGGRRDPAQRGGVPPGPAHSGHFRSAPEELFGCGSGVPAAGRGCSVTGIRAPWRGLWGGGWGRAAAAGPGSTWLRLGRVTGPGQGLVRRGQGGGGDSKGCLERQGLA